MTQSMGHQAQLAMDDSTIDGMSEPYEFLSETLKRTQEVLDTNAVRGTRSHAKERTRYGRETIGGTITLPVSPADLDVLLPRILGGSESTDVFPLAETLPSFNVMIDRVADAYLYSTCYVNRAVFRITPGFCTLDLDIMAKTMTAGQSFPSLTLPITEAYEPYVMTDATLTLDSTAREFDSVEIIIDNALEVDFRNSTTATDIDPGDRIVSVNVVLPNIGTNADLIDHANGVQGFDGDLTLAKGNLSTEFAFASLQVPDEDGTVPGKGRLTFPLNMTARQSSTTKELIVTNDSAA